MSQTDDLQSVVAALQLNNYISVVIATVVVYDYIVTFAKEINYVWNWSWTWVSTLFIVVRYVGSLVALLEALYGTIFIPGPPLACVFLSHIATVIDIPWVGTVLILVANWAFIVYLAAADLVMILRIYALYKGSKIVLGALLLCYAPMMILLAIDTGYYNNPKTYLIVTNPQVLNASICNVTFTADVSATLGSYTFIPRFVLGALMFIFSLVQFFKESFEMYKATKQWKPNQYINLLVREGVAYFFAHLLYNINAAVTTTTYVGTPQLMTDMLSYILLYILTPRFIMSVRELYVRDSHRGGQRGPGIDSGFGLSGQLLSLDAGLASMRFVDVEANNAATEQTSEIGMVDVATKP